MSLYELNRKVYLYSVSLEVKQNFFPREEIKGGGRIRDSYANPETKSRVCIRGCLHEKTRTGANFTLG